MDSVANGDPALDFLNGGGEMARRILAHDWTTTLGPPASWPQSLKTALRIALSSRYPIWMGWGPDLVNLYNDPYVPVLGQRDAWALGASAREVWKEVWVEHLGPQADAVLHRGEASWNDQRQMVMYRNGYAEETYFTFSFSPLPADGGGVGGLFCACTEDTQKVLGERRLAALRELAAATANARAEHDACAVAAEVLSKHGGDIAFARIYLASEAGPRLAASTDSLLDVPAGESSVWPFDRAAAEGAVVLRDLPGTLSLPAGAWPEAAHTACVLPLARAGHDAVRGWLVVGASPRLPFDALYESFFELLARGLADALSNARAYEDERRRAESLAELDRAKTTFFSNVSHEFRTPLTLMLGPVEDLLGASRLAGSDREQLSLVHRNSLRLLKLVNTMLDFSRIEAGRIAANFEPVDLPAYTAELASSFRSACDRAGLVLTLDCPPLEAPQPAYVDRDMWEKIVLNLLSNAFKFTLQGSISVRVERAGDEASLVVEDTGVGIPEAELPRMFERFHRVQHAHARTHEGTGIGLALVQELVRLHGGTVEVTSTLGVGTTFTVRLPLGHAHHDAAKVQHPSSQAPTRTDAQAFVEEALRWLPGADEALDPAVLNLSGDDQPGSTTSPAPAEARPRIVWADDNADLRDYVRRMLAGRYDVEAVADGEAALAAARAIPPELVLSDVMMPRLDGFGLLSALRADPALAEVPVILLSARAGEESRIEGLQAGADDYLVKPFSARELLARVDAHIKLARMRRESAAALAAAQRRIESALLAGNVATYEWDIRANDFRGDRNFGPIFGVVPPPEGTSPLELFLPVVHPDDLPEVKRKIEHTLATGAPYQAEYRVRHPERGERWIDARGAIVSRDANNAPILWTGVLLDITDRKTTEAALRESDRRKDEFLATLAHELRNPLAPIRNALHLLNMAGGAVQSDRIHEMLERQVGHMVRLVDDLMEASRISRGKLELKREAVDLRQVVRHAVETSRPLIDRAGHRIEVQVPDEALPVLGDSVRLGQILANLLNNASKYTEDGGRIKISAHREGEAVVVTVQDSGIGIAPEQLPRLFEMFAQVDSSAARSHGGLGIGLALAKRLTEMHGGTITATSRGIGSGTTFTVRLAIGTPGDAATAPPKPAETLHARRMLVVDDNKDSADSLGMLLRFLGAEVRVEHGGRAALTTATEWRPSVILLDLGMPGMDGFEVARQLRASRDLSGAKLIALTGWGQEDDRRRTQAAGFDHHLIKPVDLNVLHTLLVSLQRDGATRDT